MKIYVCSDLHLEFGNLQPHNNDNADVLILSGDILIARHLSNWTVKSQDSISTYGDRYLNFFSECKRLFKHVIYVMGNHEHYDFDYAKTPGLLKSICDYYDIIFLDKSNVTIDDYTFIGGTLWTDMNNNDSRTLSEISYNMNDFRVVYNSIENDVLTPNFVVTEHENMLKYIDEVTADTSKKYIVVGHHAPSKKSTNPKYKKDWLMNGGYSSDLDSFIINHPQIKLWTHGHTHDVFDYVIGETRIVCNPRGYHGYEQRASDFDFLLIEV